MEEGAYLAREVSDEEEPLRRWIGRQAKQVENEAADLVETARVSALGLWYLAGYETVLGQSFPVHLYEVHCIGLAQAQASELGTRETAAQLAAASHMCDAPRVGGARSRKTRLAEIAMKRAEAVLEEHAVPVAVRA